MTNFGDPYIQVEDGDYRKARELYLRHLYEGREIDLAYAERILQYLYQIWGRPVHLETVVEGKPVRLTCEGEKVRRGEAVKTGRRKPSLWVETTASCHARSLSWASSPEAHMFNLFLSGRTPFFVRLGLSSLSDSEEICDDIDGCLFSLGVKSALIKLPNCDWME